MFNNIEKTLVNDFITLRGISANDFIKDIGRIYKYYLDSKEADKTKLFFKVAVNGVIFRSVAITFHKYFALEMYFIFSKLYEITSKSVYKSAMDVLLEDPSVAKYFTPMLELPTEIAKKLDSLEVPLFPYQRKFMEAYYNARNKLGFDGYLLAFEQGLGKTFTAIAAAYAFNLMPAIITAPKSTLDGWKNSIVKMIPGTKPEEVKLSYEYYPNRDKVKWKFFICNYERIDQGRQYADLAVAPPKAIFIDSISSLRI